MTSHVSSLYIEIVVLSLTKGLHLLIGLLRSKIVRNFGITLTRSSKRGHVKP